MSTLLDHSTLPRAEPGGNGYRTLWSGPQCWRIPKMAMTLPGFRSWVGSDDFPEKVRTAFVDGEIIIDMSQEEIITHAGVKASTSSVLINLVTAAKSGRFFLDGVLITNEAAEISNNPDGLFLSCASLQAGKFRLIPRNNASGQFIEVEGSPDWVMEIVSDSSVRKDTIQLRRAYYQAGIPEFWLIDARGEVVDFQVLRRGAVQYEAAPVEDSWLFSATFERWFRIEKQQGAFGTQFSLLVKAP